MKYKLKFEGRTLGENTINITRSDYEKLRVGFECTKKKHQSVDIDLEAQE